jgi:hypothetical protein
LLRSLSSTITTFFFSQPPSHIPLINQEKEKEVNSNSLLLSSLEVPLVLLYPNPNCLETSRKPPSPCPYLFIWQG